MQSRRRKEKKVAGKKSIASRVLQVRTKVLLGGEDVGEIWLGVLFFGFGFFNEHGNLGLGPSRMTMLGA